MNWGNWGVRLLSAATAFAGFTLGCSTTPEPDTAVLPPPGPVTFVPGATVANLQVEEARYPNLFSPESYAVWVTSAVASMKLAADEQAGIADMAPGLANTAALTLENFYVFEIHLSSVFPDASIAYDVVGLRNLDMFLATPDGRNVYPVQRIMDTELNEEMVGALRKYERTNILVFPKRDLFVNQPVIGEGVPGVRLVVQGFHSSFYFEFPSAIEPMPEGGRFSDSQAVQAVKLGFTELFLRLRALESHLK